jgi:prephenate dehydrogenase
LIGATATLNPRYLWDGLDDVHHAQADLFVGGTFMLAPSVTAHPQAIELAHEFCKLLGATPHFIDPIEHDGIVAITEGLPIVLGLANFTAFADQDGWGEVQRLSNPAFGRIAHRLMDQHRPRVGATTHAQSRERGASVGCADESLGGNSRGVEGGG